MILEKLRIKNFRQYYGEQGIEFASGSRNVTVINGTTGAGKTNMFLAINWCLYGTEDVIDNKGEIINKHALAEATEGQRVIAEVELHFQHIEPDGTESTFVALRSTRDPSILHLSRVTRRGLEELPNPSLVLNTILPKNVRTYFFFDGEKIDDFAKPEHEAQVKDAVYGVLKLEVLERARGHLSSIGDEYERELKQTDTKGLVQELLNNRDQANNEAIEARKKLDSYRKELAAANSVIAKLDEELFKQREIQADVNHRKELESVMKQIDDELAALLEDMQELGSSGYLLLGKEAIKKALATIDEKRQRGEIPAGIREQFIRDLLDKKVCICGRQITEEGPEKQTLLSLLERSMPSAIENRILETGGLLQGLKGKVEQNFKALRGLKTRKAGLEDRLVQVTKQADEISSRLKNIGVQEIEALESKRQSAQKDVTDLLILIGGKDHEIRVLDREISELDHKIEKAKGLVGKAKTAQKKLALARESAKAVAEVYELYAKEMRKKIENEAQEIFTKFVWKESQFTKVELTDDYRLTVLDRWGKPARPELSAGERQLLSLSFITALSRASEGSAPMVMDTPFGRLDTAPRENICKHLPAETEQLILFVTSEELHGKAREILTPSIGREYTLDWEKSTGCTAIRAHGGNQ